jgi:hypothetical protein
VSGKAQGEVLVDGRSRKHCRFQELCSYVQQKDVLVPSATVSSSSSSFCVVQGPAVQLGISKHRIASLGGCRGAGRGRGTEHCGAKGRWSDGGCRGMHWISVIVK